MVDPYLPAPTTVTLLISLKPPGGLHVLDYCRGEFARLHLGGALHEAGKVVCHDLRRNGFLETDDEYFDYYRRRHAFWKMYGLDLPDEVLEKLYYKNALRVIPGIDPSLFP